MEALIGSARRRVHGAEVIGDAPPDESLLVTVILRRPTDKGEIPAGQHSGRKPDPDAVTAVTDYLSGHGMEIISRHSTGTVTARTTVAQAQAAFDVQLQHYRIGSDVYRGRVGSVHLPAELGRAVGAVLGLDNRPQVFSLMRTGAGLDGPVPIQPESAAPNGPDSTTDERQATPFWPAQIARLYHFPARATGSGQCVGILACGGGYKRSDLKTYFENASVPLPEISYVAVDGIALPASTAPADEEVTLDIEILGSVAPGARIVVYFTEPTARGFLNGVAAAVHDRKNKPSVLSISWGASEDSWLEQARQSLDEAFQDAAAKGITVLAAAGDHGAADHIGDGRPHVNYPAASPHVVGCGGTTVRARRGKIVSEIGWNNHDGWAGGGGISAFIPTPAWQQKAVSSRVRGDSFHGRGVPDIAGNADVRTGYITYIGGKWMPGGGTSAVAPLYAGLVARLNELTGERMGALNEVLYEAAADADESDNPDSFSIFGDVVLGDSSVPATLNGPSTRGRRAGKGWDPVSGFGSLHGQPLLEHLQRRRSDIDGGRKGSC